jgi:hypothetical protein
MPRLPALDIQKRVNRSPHVVICGAGASRAATPNGDRAGHTLPLMNDLVDALGLGTLLARHGLDQYADDFERLYDTIVRVPGLAAVAAELDARVREYFGSLVLPDGPTAYDYLLLSLREKDIIATFNWDPLFLQAYGRHVGIRRLPQILFLHGSVGVGICLTCRVKGRIDMHCGRCKAPMSPTRLLYPIANKDYTADEFIAAEWQALRENLLYAYFVTYSVTAPHSPMLPP